MSVRKNIDLGPAGQIEFCAGGQEVKARLCDLGPSFAATLSDNADKETFVVVDRQIRAALPPVFLIWTGVVVSIVLAVAKPG